MTIDGELLMIGCGRMGGALLARWRERNAWTGAVTIVKPTPLLPGPLSRDAGVRYLPSLSMLPSGYTPRLVVLAAKPQQLPAILAECAIRLPADAFYLGLAAGLPLTRYRETLGDDARLVRAMPNSPARIGLAMTILFAAAGTTSADRALAQSLMEAVGETLWVRRETEIDAATAVAGSGPAYVFALMEAMIDAAVSIGVDAEEARLMVVQTVRGAGELARSDARPIAGLRDEVTSKGGTTESGLAVWMRPHGMPDEISRTIHAAYDRAREIAASAN